MGFWCVHLNDPGMRFRVLGDDVLLLVVLERFSLRVFFMSSLEDASWSC